jgi:large subunit ribosomal protein L13
MERRTWSPKSADLNSGRRWLVVDAEGQTLGRIATVVAAALRGKTKATYTPHADMGDFVIVVNAEKVVLTGKKETQKFYSRHSGFPGGLRRRSVREVRESHPERIVQQAVRGMLPKNVLGDRQFRKLKVYVGPDHPHATQRPEPLAVDTSAAGAR